MKIFTIANKTEKKFLRQKTAEFGFNKFTKKEINDLVKKMREVMKTHNGVGLSANQLGLDLRFFVAQVPQQRFYVIFNPQIIKFSEKKVILEEGCLSVPGMAGEVERAEKITLTGFDKNGRKIKIKAWGLLARVFQHETDHLNGILFIDKTKKLYRLNERIIKPPVSS